MSTRQNSQLMTCCHGALMVGLGLAASSAAWGFDQRETGFADDVRALLLHEANTPSLSAYELNSVVLPSLGDTAFAQPAGSARAGSNRDHHTQHIGVTRWVTPDSSDPLGAHHARGGFGLLLGMSMPAPSAGAMGVTGTVAPTSLDLGMRWRSRLDGRYQLDVTAWARAPQRGQPQDAMGMISQSQQPLYGGRAEVQWASSRTAGLVPEFGALGVQLQGGSRLVLRARKSGPMLYYRAKF